jgi:hypothetical protein
MRPVCFPPVHGDRRELAESAASRRLLAGRVSVAAGVGLRKSFDDVGELRVLLLELSDL